MRIVLDISPEMYEELLRAVGSEPGISPHGWATEAVEAALASRRLPYVTPSPHTPRMVETARDYRPLMAERRTAGPMRAADIPSAYDLEALTDIT